MAFVDPASAVVVTTATAGFTLVAARRTRGLVRDFALVLFGLSVFDVLHLPSIIAFGFDENLERHGPIVTLAGLVADYFVRAAVLMLLARSWRVIACRSDGTARSDR